MIIRTAQIEDLPRLAKCAEEFYASSRFLKGFDLGRFVQVWTNLIQGDTGAVFLVEYDRVPVGALGGVVYPEMYSGELIATEFFWFVRDTHRGAGMRLYREFELWARAKECTQIQMVHLNDSMPDKLKRVYERLGYAAAETRYVKELR